MATQLWRTDYTFLSDGLGLAVSTAELGSQIWRSVMEATYNKYGVNLKQRKNLRD